ncbi:MAG TPA: hypothetical protein H9734_01320 [Candidatus Fusicatenibacter merdavium]|uniref:V-type ATP synthase subunit H n=1 Tax=Candidatus Fusicatenibacter merdavium TaxID=2838600 RepID=A0A9D2BI16_9FIRM|nr:hypothetical protein [Candidatus Fusicatenibacter merdavium]
MIRDLLQSAREAEQEADRILERAEAQSRRIREEAQKKADAYRRQKQEEFAGRARKQREMVQQEEDVKRIAARESLSLELGKLRDDAVKKEAEAVAFLLAEVF